MENLLVVIAQGLVEDKDAVNVTVDEPLEDGTVVYHLHVAQDDMGRVIGKAGTDRQGDSYDYACCIQPRQHESRGRDRLIRL